MNMPLLISSYRVYENRRRTMHRTVAKTMLMLILALSWPTARLHAAEYYVIDQRFGEIGFKVSCLDLFDSSGTFDRYTGHINLDQAHPENTSIAVVINMDSVKMSWASASAMLRSPAYFDVQKYKTASFTSTRIVPTTAGHYEIDGNLQLRGVTKPIVLHAALLSRRAAAAPNMDEADFIVTGTLPRSEFGMTADQSFVSNQVELSIKARLQLKASPTDSLKSVVESAPQDTQGASSTAPLQ